MAQILCSTGALIGRPNNRDYRLLESFAKQLHCDGFEFKELGEKIYFTDEVQAETEDEEIEM